MLFHSLWGLKLVSVLSAIIACKHILAGLCFSLFHHLFVMESSVCLLSVDSVSTCLSVSSILPTLILLLSLSTSFYTD